MVRKNAKGPRVLLHHPQRPHLSPISTPPQVLVFLTHSPSAPLPRPSPSAQVPPPATETSTRRSSAQGCSIALRQEGVKYLFVSNSDNLGATLSLDLLTYFATSGKNFLMEVCERSESDKKGGHLAVRKSDGKFILRESAMCPKDDAKHFEDISLHKFFNTNNPLGQP